MGFEVKDHLRLGADLGLMDFEAGAAVAGTKFAYLRGMHRGTDMENDSASGQDLRLCSCVRIDALVLSVILYPRGLGGGDAITVFGLCAGP